MKEKKKIKGYVINSLYSLVPFEFLYKALGIVLFLPLFSSLFDLAIKVSKYSYVTEQNIFPFLSSPFTIFILIIVFLIFALYVYIEILAVIIAFNHSLYGYRITLKYLGYQTFLALKKSLYWKNLPILLFSTLFIPILGFSFSNSALSNISIYKYVSDILDSIGWVSLVKFIGLCFVYFFCFIFMFVFCFFLLNDLSPFQAAKESTKLIKGRFFKTLGRLIKFSFRFFPIYLLALILIVLFYSIMMNINSIPKATTILFGILIGIATFMLITMETVMLISIFGFSTIEFHELQNVKQIPVHPDLVKKIPLNLTMKIQRIVFVLFGIIIAGQAIIFYISKDTSLLGNIDGSTLVTAHRTLGTGAPENSLLGLKGCIENMIDFAEIDVQETKDGVIVVLHDSNLKKYSSGVCTKNIWEVNYDEIKDLDFGSWVNPSYKDTRIATLEEVIELVNGKMRLNIELKDNGHSVSLAKRVDEIISKNNFYRDVTITSQNLSMLREIKKCNENYEVGYIVSIGLGNYYNESDIDFYSVNYNFINENIVKKIHREGKKVHVWTINDETLVDSLTDMGVDNIITDIPLEVKKEVVVKRTKKNFAVGRLFSLLGI